MSEPAKTVAIRCKGTSTAGLDDLVPFQGELKKLSRSHFAKLRESIERKGFLFPIFVWPHGGVLYLLDGHQRVKVLTAMQTDGWAIPPLPIVELPARDKKEAREKLLLISSRYGVIDPEGMSWFIEDSDIDLPEMAELTEFPEINLVELISPTPTEGEDELPLLPPEICSPGEIWALGPHRLLVGSATDRESVKQLFGGAEPFMMVTDPPYGVAYDPGWRERYDPRWHYRKQEVVGDRRHGWAEAYRLFPGPVAYIWHGGRFSGELYLDVAASGFEVRTQIIWRKQTSIFGRGHYHWQHEPCWYAVRKGGSAQWVGGHKQSTIWDMPNVHRTQGTTDDMVTEHSTQKPVEAMARPMRNHGKAGSLVYDPFVGSGTSIIAAEREGRICYAVEISPVNANIVVERYKKYLSANGREATVERIAEGVGVDPVGGAHG